MAHRTFDNFCDRHFAVMGCVYFLDSLRGLFRRHVGLHHPLNLPGAASVFIEFSDERRSVYRQNRFCDIRFAAVSHRIFVNFCGSHFAVVVCVYLLDYFLD